jgi:hypothetical protein
MLGNEVLLADWVVQDDEVSQLKRWCQLKELYPVMKWCQR